LFFSFFFDVSLEYSAGKLYLKELVMIKKISLLVLGGALFLSASEKKPKDIYTAQDLMQQVAQARQEYQKNKDKGWDEFLSKGNRINHVPEIVVTPTSDQPKK
jgi:hypothetical protein